jgi:hypothetical protein
MYGLDDCKRLEINEMAPEEALVASGRWIADNES